MDANNMNQQSPFFSFGDKEFLHYLGRKVKDAQLPTDAFVPELDLYAMKKHPWEILGASQVRQRTFYFYNTLRRMGTTEGSKKKRKKCPNGPKTSYRYLRTNRCGGRWKLQKTINVKDGDGLLIGERRNFLYSAGCENDDMNRWVMHEYCVDVEDGIYEGCELRKFKNYALYCLINYIDEKPRKKPSKGGASTSVPEEESISSKEANWATPTFVESEISDLTLSVPLDQAERNQVSVYPGHLYGNATNVNTCVSIESIQPESNCDRFWAFNRDDISKVPDANAETLMSQPIEPICNDQAYHRRSYMQERFADMDIVVSQLPHPTITNQVQMEFMLSQSCATIPEQAQPENLSSPNDINIDDLGDYLANTLDISEANMEHSKY